eukprot:143325-Pleurochrysis_carterae.AAC.3
MQEQRGEMSLEEEQRLKKKVLKGSWGIAKDKASIHASIEKVQSYEEAFAKIQAATGISDIDELVTTFINAEDQNFALFNYVNELNTECEKLEEQISELKSEIDKYKGQGLNTDNQRKKILKDLEDRLQRTEAKAAQARARARTHRVQARARTRRHAPARTPACASGHPDEARTTVNEVPARAPARACIRARTHVRKRLVAHALAQNLAAARSPFLPCAAAHP